MFRQSGGRLRRRPTRADASQPQRCPFCMLTELTGDDKPELVCRLMGQGTRGAGVRPVRRCRPRALDLLPQTGFEDVAAADFDNDGRIDLFLARKNPPGAVAFGRPSARQLVASVSIDKGDVDQPIGLHVPRRGPAAGAGGRRQPGGRARRQSVFTWARRARTPQASTSTCRPAVGAPAAAAPGAQAGVLHRLHGARPVGRCASPPRARRWPPASRSAQEVQVASTAAGPISRAGGRGRDEGRGGAVSPVHEPRRQAGRRERQARRQQARRWRA